MLPTKRNPKQSRSNATECAVRTNRSELASDKTYLTVPELSGKLDANESEILSAIRFGALAVERFPVRGALKFRIEENAARVFARRFYARLI